MNKKNILFIVIALIVVVLICFFFFFKKEKMAVDLTITCNNDTLTNNYKVGDTFKCSLLGEEYTIKIDHIDNEKIQLSSSEYGLYPKRKDNSTINLNEKIKDFELNKGDELVLSLQAADAYNEEIIIYWK